MIQTLESSPFRDLRHGGRHLPTLVAAMACLLFLSSSDRMLGDDGKAVFWIIPHTHWEGAVFKTREEYLTEGLPHILTALRLLKEYPEYRFALDQVEYIRPFLERYPEEGDAFRKFIAEGRLEIVCGLNVMPDDNMPSGESFVRQMLYAKGYCRNVLGVEVKTGWLLDTFGHHAQIPQILRLAGYDCFWFSRGVEDRSKMPSDFLWQGIDGTQIPAVWLPFSYGNVYEPPRDFSKFAPYMKKRYDDLSLFTHSALDRVGMDGADVTDPELYFPGLAEQFNSQADRPFTIRYGVPNDYYQNVLAKRKDLPVVTGERNPLFQGVYSSRIELKERMRDTERLLTTAEKFGALANSFGTPVDENMIWRAWEPALFNVTHDLASGVMMDHVYADVVRGYDFSQRLANEMISNREDTVLANVDSRGAGIALAVFNTLGWRRTDVGEGEVGFAQGGVKDFELHDAEGKTIPSQVLDSEFFQDGGLRRVQFAFIAQDVPAMGLAVYHVVPRSTGNETMERTTTNQNGLVENEYYSAGFDLSTGALTNLTVKAGDWQALSGPANVVASEADKGDFWELYTTLDGGQSLIMKRPLEVPHAGQARFSTDEVATNGVANRGPVFSEIVVQHAFGTNSFATSARIYHGLSRIDFTTRILNNDQFVRYRLLVPTSIKNGRNFQEIPFGAIERPMSQEFPAQNWADYSDADHGVALINRGMPGNNISDGTMMLSLLRSTRIDVYWGVEAQRSNSGLELGKELTLHYALEPHAGDWRTAGVYKTGLEFNNPLIVRKIASHAGTLPDKWGMLEVAPNNVVLSAFKPANDGTTIVRVYEASGLATTGATIKLRDKVISAHEANLMEDTGKELKAKDNALRFDLHPFEIKTFKLRLKKTVI
jgi:alpha-mannosidase